MKIIQMKCPACGATFDISEDRTNFFCQYCGTKLHLDDESKTIHINHRIDHKIEQTVRNVDEAAVREADAKALKQIVNDRNNKRTFIGCLVVLLIAVLFYGGLWISTDLSLFMHKQEISNKQEAGLITPGDYQNYEKDTYQEAKAKLEALGFTNITLVDLDDAFLFVRKADTIKSLSINGKTKFNSNDYYEPEVPIVITFH